MKDLGSFGGVQTASVNGLNERGEVVGGLLLPGDQQIHPFLWDGEKLVDLVAPPFGGPGNGEAQWINDAGEVVGGAALRVSCPGGNGHLKHAFLWREGVITDLGGLPETPVSAGIFINSKSQVVGFSRTCDFSILNAFLWEQGSMVDLNTLISPNSTFHLYWAGFIDDLGEIGAFGMLPNGDSHAVLLVPCDENHPGIAGCDYSLVDASAAPSSRPAATKASGPMPPASLWNIGNQIATDFSMETSVALIIAETLSPTLRFIRLTEPVVIIAVTSPEAVRSISSETTLSETIPIIVPGIRFRMLVSMIRVRNHIP
jgi:probable HAF family extracellular repeat protein